MNKPVKRVDDMGEELGLSHTINPAVRKAINKAIKNPEPHYVSGLQLPVGMRIEVVDRMVYFITDDKRDLLTLHRKLEQTSIAARDAFYGKWKLGM